MSAPATGRPAPARRALARAVVALADALEAAPRVRAPLTTSVIEGSPLDLTVAAAHYVRHVLDALRAERVSIGASSDGTDAATVA